MVLLVYLFVIDMSITSMLVLWLKLYSLLIRNRRYHPDAQFLFQVCLGSEVCPSLLKTVGLGVPARYIRAFLCSVFVLQVQTVLLNVLQLPMFSETFTYLEPEWFALIIFHNGIFLLIKILIIFSINICKYIFLAAQWVA
jgi:hypothetical protein